MRKLKIITLTALSATLLLTAPLQLTANATESSSKVNNQEAIPRFAPVNPYADLWWGFPLTGSEQTITSDFGLRPGEFHKGIDLRANFIKIYAVQNGTILSSGDWGNGNGGKYIALETDDVDPDTGKKLIVRYLHLSKQDVTKGRVTKDQNIGVSGNSGGVAAHLHFDVNNAGKYSGLTQSDMIDPKIFYPSPRVKFTYVNSLLSNTDSLSEHNDYDNPEYFFDNALIDFVGRNAFNQWKTSTPEKDTTVSAFKKYFKISDKKEKELKEAYYKIQ